MRPNDGRGRPVTENSAARKRALAEGRKNYFTGVPCLRGHIAPRSTGSGGCHQCVRERANAKYKSDPERHREYSRKQNRKLAESYSGFRESDPKLCVGCKTIKSDADFASDRFTKDGRKIYCRACVSEQYSKWSQGPGYEKRQEKAKAAKREFKEANPKMAWCRQAKNAAQRRSVQKGWTNHLTVDWLYDNAPDVCPLLGIPLRYDRVVMGEDSPAVDRIDNDAPYVPENCWIISCKANRIKTNATVDEIEMVARNFRKFIDARASTETVKPKQERERDDAETTPRARPKGNPYAA